MMPDLLPFLAGIARRELPSGIDVHEALRRLNDGESFPLLVPQRLPLNLDGVEQITPDAPEAVKESVNLCLVLHTSDPRATAAEVEERLTLGQRVVLVDRRWPASGDPELIHALLASTVYISNLAAYDTDLTRALVVAMTPLRDGNAFRHLLAHQLVYLWAWQSTVQGELNRRFGAVIPLAQRPRAITQARARLGAHLVRLHRRGLRYHIAQLDFPDGRVDSLTYTLEPFT